MLRKRIWVTARRITRNAKKPKAEHEPPICIQHGGGAYEHARRVELWASGPRDDEVLMGTLIYDPDAKDAVKPT